MLDDDDGDAGSGDLSQEPAESFGVLRAEARRGLVEQEHLGSDRQSPGDLHQPPVDVRQGPGILFERALVADELEQCLGSPARFGPVSTAAEQRGHD